MINSFFISLWTLIILLYGCENNASYDPIFYPVSLSYSLGEIIVNNFSDISLESMTVKPLIDGQSGAVLLLLDCGERKYVAKIHQDFELESEISAELYSLEQAAKIGLAPEVFYCTKNKKGILLEFIEGGTTSLPQLRHYDNIERMAYALRKIHTIERSSDASTDKARAVRLRVIEFVERYKEHTYDDLGMRKDIENAIATLYLELDKLMLFDVEKVMIHGDLHPRNMFMSEDRITFVDWCFASWDDPFFDIATIAITGGYTQEDEQRFFSAYFMRDITDEEQVRYNIIKKIGLLYTGLWWCFCVLRAVDQGEVVTDTDIIHKYGHYSALLNQGIFLAQIAYEATLSAFKEATLLN